MICYLTVIYLVINWAAAYSVRGRRKVIHHFCNACLCSCDGIALCALLTEVILKGLTLQKIVFDICVCVFSFMFVQRLVLWIDLTKGLYMYESFEMCL